jgi:hypothetical protein
MPPGYTLRDAPGGGVVDTENPGEFRLRYKPRLV